MYDKLARKHWQHLSSGRIWKGFLLAQNEAFRWLLSWCVADYRTCSPCNMVNLYRSLGDKWIIDYYLRLDSDCCWPWTSRSWCPFDLGHFGFQSNCHDRKRRNEFNRHA